MSTYRVWIPLSLCQETWFLTQNFKISSFLETSRNFLELWILPGNGHFLPILTYWASIQLNFCHWTWIWPIQLKNFMFLIPLVSFGFWNKWHLKTSKWPCFLVSVLNYCFVQIDKLLPSYNLRLFSWKNIRITITFSLCHPHHYFNLYVCSSLWCTAYGVCHTGTPSNDLMFLCSEILKFCVENQVSWHKQSGIHSLYVDISKN